MLNQLFEFYDSLVNLDNNGRIMEAMASVTNEVGEISELAVLTEAESNICDVYKGSFNHLKIAHTKKTLICNYFKAVAPADDIIIYDVIIRFNSTNSTTLPTVLCSLNVSSFVSMDAGSRDAAETGVLANSANLAVDFTKLAAMKNISTYLVAHNNFHNAVKQALIAAKPFA